MEFESGFFVDECAIKCRELSRGGHWDRVVVPKEIFIEAYNKWIKNSDNPFFGADDADDWCDD